ncbi:LuxR C-terminal-related transcriptional regulator [Streptomyces griseoloalbus]|uniref:DNA-binding CsgD family transcriptional regulator/tetratricopeptide (TPR) repeat protein n=1 Tax=Streptomyces griseoloalbus TaxID=67303 RepID=A0A7W8BMI0_9ACTN|nr:LuxR C-terminal-related transcriptional regulator [Streptomyces albaduncus]MBB5126030.1 DNA-binding CsgD family transcriptional regulator/tetratricopeptide (TPR) repeat protein [Streptomyces albaduncus]
MTGQTTSRWQTFSPLLDGLRTGGVRVVTGDPGCGRTSFVEHAARSFHAGPVWHVRADPARSAQPLSGLHTLLRAAGGSVRVLGDGTAGEVLFDALRAAADASPLLVCVDDAHLWDAASRAALGHAAARVHAAGVGVGLLLTVPGHRPVGREWAALPLLRLGPLAPADAARLVDDVTDGAVDPGVRQELVTEAEGNPALLLALIHRLSPAQLGGLGALPRPLADGEVLAGVVGGCLTGLPPDRAGLLLTAAAAVRATGEPDADADVVLRAAGGGADADAAGLPLPEVLVLVEGRIRFRSALLGRAVYALAPPDRRRAAHRALAESLADSGGVSALLHRSWSVSGPAPALADGLSTAATDPASALSPGLRRRALTRAAELTPGAAQRAHRYTAAAEQAVLAGHSPEARRLLDAARSHPAPASVRGGAELLRGAVLLADGPVDDARESFLLAAALLSAVRREDADTAVLGAADAAWAAGDPSACLQILTPAAPTDTAPGLDVPAVGGLGSGTASHAPPGPGAPVTSALGSGGSVDTAHGLDVPAVGAFRSGTASHAPPGPGAPAGGALGSGVSVTSTFGPGATSDVRPGAGASATHAFGPGAPATSLLGSGVPAVGALGSGTASDAHPGPLASASDAHPGPAASATGALGPAASAPRALAAASATGAVGAGGAVTGTGGMVAGGGVTVVAAAGQDGAACGLPAPAAEAVGRDAVGIVPPRTTRSALLRDHRDGMRAVLLGRFDQAAPPLRRVVEWGLRGDEPEPLLRSAAAALMLGEVTAARRAGARALAAARTRGSAALEPRALEYLAYAELRAGRHQLARTHAEEGLRTASRTGQRNTAAHHHAALALAASIEGEKELVTEHVTAALHTARRHGLAQAATLAQWAAARADLGAGRPREAADRLGPLVRPGARRGHFAVWMLAVPCFVEAAALAGRPEQAATVVEDFALWAACGADPQAPAQLLRCRALLAATDAADELFLRALDRHEETAGDFERARTDLLHGKWLRRRRRLREARARLGEALMGFERCGAHLWAQQTAAELRAGGAAPAETGGGELSRLTPQQLRIARCVAEGATNREVALRLSVSTRTVDYHLRNVFATLGVRSRVELARLVEQAEKTGAQL